jgi:hypothetical protein
MKFLNTHYINLFDVSQGCSDNGTQTYNTNAYTPGYCTKNISTVISTTSLYVKFLYYSSYRRSDFALLLNIRTVNGGSNLLIYETAEQIKITNANNTFSQIVNVPSKTTSSNFHYRTIMIHFDTVQNLAELYSDGILYASVSCGNNGENIHSLLVGALDAGTYKQYQVFFSNIIISDSPILLTESVKNVTPTISSTDWTVSSGVASADTVGDTMTLTLPSGSIDETRRTVTGYSAAFLNCSSSETINAVTVEQSGTTKQVVLPSGGSVETLDTFTISSASDVSALVTAAYI